MAGGKRARDASSASEKKKKRRLSGVQDVVLQSNNDEQEVALTPSRTRTPKKSKKMRRSLATSNDWEGDLSEIYRSCIQLGTQNKINAKNAWNLRLLDYIDNVLDAEDVTAKKKAAEAGARAKSSDPLERSICNFQLASNTLDTSVKIYACRVDAVHTDAYKVLGGLNRTEVSANVKEALADDDDDGSDDEGAAKKKKPRKTTAASLASTLESNVANINNRSLDMECAVDPLFHKTSAAFDEGGAKGLLLSQLGVSEGCNIVFDSTEYQPEKIPEIDQALNTADIMALVPSDWASFAVCPYFADFSFHDLADTPAKKLTDLAKDKEAQQAPALESMFNVVPADFPTLDELEVPSQAGDAMAGAGVEGGFEQDDQAFGGGFDGGADNFGADDYSPPDMEMGDGVGDDLGGVEAVAGVIGEIFGTGNIIKEFDYSKVLGEGTNEFTYFNKRLMDNWAGPEHWKFKAPAKSAATSATAKPKGKKKEFFIDFFAEDDTDYEALFKKPARGTTTLSAQVLNKEVNNTLPPDKHYDIKTLTRLFLRPNKPIGYRRVAGSAGPRDDEDDDTPLNWAPLDDATETFDMGGEDNHFGGDDWGAMDNDDSNGAELGEGLVDAPEAVRHVPITFAKRAKKVDVEKLKGCIWKQLCSVDKPEGEQEEEQQEGEEPKVAKIEAEEPISFNSILSDLPKNVPAKQLPDVSVPMCFICLLDLANKKGLQIGAEGSDLTIQNYVPTAS